METPKGLKVAIVGGAHIGLDVAIERLNGMFDVEIVTPERAAELHSELMPEPITFEVKPLPEIEMPFRPPMTRRERRAQERKRNK